jgi:hypothetical protein
MERSGFMETIIYAAVLLDICAIVLIFSSYLEKRTGEKVWGKVTDEMELADEVNVYDLECDEILIGRHAMADIRIQDMSVSRYHAILNVTDGKWMITDIGSKSGVFVNGEPVRHVRLYEGDVITLGNCSLIFRKRVNR